MLKIRLRSAFLPYSKINFFSLFYFITHEVTAVAFVIFFENFFSTINIVDDLSISR